MSLVRVQGLTALRQVLRVQEGRVAKSCGTLSNQEGVTGESGGLPGTRNRVSLQGPGVPAEQSHSTCLPVLLSRCGQASGHLPLSFANEKLLSTRWDFFFFLHPRGQIFAKLFYFLFCFVLFLCELQPSLS